MPGGLAFSDLTVPARPEPKHVALTHKAGAPKRRVGTPPAW